MSELEKVKLWIGIDHEEDDPLIKMLLETADEILGRRTKFPKDYQSVKIEAVVVAYNQRGSEGTRNASADGISASWFADTMEQFMQDKLPAIYVV